MKTPCLADFGMDGVTLARCTACGASLVFAVLASGKRIPMDPEPSDRGNVACRIVEGRGLVAHVFGKADATEARAAGAVLYLSHFATCPDVARFRNRKAKP